MRFVVRQLNASTGLWRWTLFTASGKALATSVEMYLSLDECLADLELTKSCKASSTHVEPPIQRSGQAQRG